MKNQPGLLKLFIILLSFYCSEAVSEIKVPFGIRHYDIGQAQNFSLEDVEGERFVLEETRGNWIFLHFWASWCAPCRAMEPLLEKLVPKIEALKIGTGVDNDNEMGPLITAERRRPKGWANGCSISRAGWFCAACSDNRGA